MDLSGAFPGAMVCLLATGPVNLEAHSMKLYGEHSRDGRIFLGFYKSINDARDRIIKSMTPGKDFGNAMWSSLAYEPILVFEDGSEYHLFRDGSLWEIILKELFIKNKKIKVTDHDNPHIAYPRTRTKWRDAESKSEQDYLAFLVKDWGKFPKGFKPSASLVQQMNRRSASKLLKG